MINVTVGNCSVDILPVIKGLVSEYERVKEAADDSYDTFAVSLGKEDIVAVGMRDELKDGQELEDLDIVYLHYLGEFGETGVPSPAFSAIVDAGNELSVPVAALDMEEEVFSKVYCDTISTFELLKEGRLVKKALKKNFDRSLPEAFVNDWDSFVNDAKGFRELCRMRERYMAGRIKVLAKNSKRMLAVIETERIKGIMPLLESNG